MPAKVQIQIVTWNSKEHLERLFRGIQNQYKVGYSVLVIDNASEDGTQEWLKNQNYILNIKVIQNKENKGFAIAHNQGFQESKSPYILVLNPDTELQESFLKEVVDTIDKDTMIASVGGMLFQELPTDKKSGIIDSCGLKMCVNGRIIDIKQNTSQRANFSPKTDVFGVSGACVLYRLSAIKQIKDKYGILDERFGSYKEDADLAWRLNKAGFKAKIAPQAIAWHERVFGKGSRASQSNKIKQLSIRNNILMLKKNFSWKDLWRLPIMAGYEFIKFIYIYLFERENLVAYKK